MSTAILNIDKKMALIPKLRFPEFEDKWELKKILDFAPLQRGFDLPVNDIKQGKYPVVFSNGILKTHNEFKAKAPGVVTGRSGTIGKVTFIEQDYWPHNTSLWVTDFKNNDPKYVYFFYSNFKLERLGTGSSVPTLNRNDVHAKKAFFPTLPEQQKIASFLSSVDEKIQQLSRKKELLEQYKKGVMQQLFSGKLRFKDENGKDYPDWEEKKLGEVAKFSKGKGISKSEVCEDGINECIRYGELYTRYGEVIQNIFSKTNFDINKAVISQANDVIIPASGETQIDIATASCVMKSGVILGGDLNIIRSKNNGIFLSYYLNSARKLDIANLAQGISVVHLYSSQLSLLNLSLPCIEEQQKIANFLSGIDVKIENTNQQINQMQNFKKGLLQQLFV